MVSPFWLGNVVLTAVLLLVRREIRPVLLGAGLAGFFLFDVQTGVPIRSIIWLILSNAVEVLIAVFCLSHAFEGSPRLNSVKALAKYSFYAVFLAPFVGRSWACYPPIATIGQFGRWLSFRRRSDSSF